MRFIAQAAATPSRASEARSSTRRASWTPAARWRCGVYPRRSRARATVERRVWPGDQVISATALRQVQADLVDAAERRRELLDQPHAGGAVDPFEVEPRAAAVGADRLGRLGLQAPVVEVLEAPPRDAGRLERCRSAARRAGSTDRIPTRGRACRPAGTRCSRTAPRPPRARGRRAPRGRSARTPRRRSGGGPRRDGSPVRPFRDGRLRRDGQPGRVDEPERLLPGRRCAAPRPRARRCARASGSSRAPAAARRVRPTG